MEHDRDRADETASVREPWPLTGRAEELDRLLEVLFGGRGAAVLVARPGLGRSRLAAEVVRTFEATHAVVRASGTAAASSIPFGALARTLPDANADSRLVDLEHAIVGTQRDPVLVVVDDGHLIDDSSAALLHHLVIGGRASVLVTVAEGRRVPDAVTALWKDNGAERIDLAPLDRRTVGDLLAAVVGGPFDPLAERDLWELSGGAPLYLRELLLSAAAEGAIVREEALWRIAGTPPLSPRLVEIVEAPVADLDETALRCLRLLALARELGLGLLVALVGDRAVGDLEARDLLIVDNDGRRRPCRLASTLLARVVRDRLPVATAVALRISAIEALEDPGRRVDDQLRAAELRLDAGLEPDAELVLAAARQAYFANELTRAERLARASVERTAGLDAQTLLAQVLFTAGRAEEAESVLQSIDATEATVPQRTFLTMLRAQNLFGNLHRPDDAFALIDEMYAAATEDEWRDEIVGARANFLLLQGRPLEALEALQPLVDRTGGSVLSHHQIATVAAPSHALVGHTTKAIEIAERSLERRRALGDSLHAVDAHVHLVALVVAYQEAGRLAEAEALAQRGHDDAVAARSFDGRGFSALGLGRVALAQGRPETATRYFSEATLVYRDLSARACLRWALGGLAFARAMVGDVDGAVTAVADLDRAPSTSVRMLESDLLRARAWTAHLERRPGRAKQLLLEAAIEARESGQHSLESSALHDLVRMGEAGHAVDRLAELAEYVDGGFAAARAEHARALEASDAVGLDRIAEAFEDIGALLVATEAASEAARLHQEAGRTRPATRSAVRARLLHDRCEGARPGSLPWAAIVEPLTRREREIALLAAEGLTSPAIGERLSLSVRTVDNHLRRTYTKLGISGRHELAPAIAHW